MIRTIERTIENELAMFDVGKHGQLELFGNNRKTIAALFLKPQMIQ